MTALQLICPRVVVGRANDKLPDVAAALAKVNTHHLVVLTETTDELLGVIRLADVAWRANASARILGDLISAIRPVVILPNESATAVSVLFVQHRLGEAAVVDTDGRYLGLITGESMLAWNYGELQRTRNLLRLEEEALRTAQSRMQGTSAEREQYLAQLSHKLRSPLNPVLLIASSRAMRADLPEDVRRDFGTIAQNAAQEARLIDELIDGARASRQPPPPAT